ncbi:MAG: acyl-CoA thioesterase/bile acid-CoA:amino acid N-acyltransferase family protein, partial [Pseudomonadota bacterium]
PVERPFMASPLQLKFLSHDALLDDAFALRILGVPSGQRADISAQMTDENGCVWRSHAIFYADMNGIVDTQTDPSVGGTYTGVSANGLLWSMMPAAPAQLSEFLNGIADHPTRTTVPVFTKFEPVPITIRVEVDDGSCAEATFLQRPVAPTVTIEEIEEDGVAGVCFMPPGDGPHPGVVVVPGSNGGTHTQSAALLASRGFAVFAMALYNYKSLPPTGENIPLEGYLNAVHWLRNRVGHDRIALRGGSRGAEGALLAAAHFPGLVKSVIAWVPTPMHLVASSSAPDTPTPLYTLNGQPLPFANVHFPVDRIMQPTTFEAPFRPAPSFMQAWKDPANREQFMMPFETIDVPVLLVSGTADEMWPSAYAADVIKAELRSRRPDVRVEHVCCTGAGHTFHVPNVVESCASATYHLINRMWLSAGGTPQANADGARRAWDHYLRFLRETTAA